jgi:competence ComEA-like helix-hairpin-helix protein
MTQIQKLAVKFLAAGLLLIFLCSCVLEAQKHPPARPVDLNAASIKELEELPGVGHVTAQRILDMRQKSGRFRRVEDLLAIRGISQKKLDTLRPYVTVSAPALTPPAQKSPPAKKPSSKQPGM